MMIEDAFRAFWQILTPPLRKILWKSIGLALILIVIVAVGIQRLFAWLLVWGEVRAQAALGGFQLPLDILVWVLTILTGLGIVLGSIFLMPAITSLVAGGASAVIPVSAIRRSIGTKRRAARS